jgi:hypothetical protein
MAGGQRLKGTGEFEECDGAKRPLIADVAYRSVVAMTHSSRIEAEGSVTRSRPGQAEVQAGRGRSDIFRRRLVSGGVAVAAADWCRGRRSRGSAAGAGGALYAIDLRSEDEASQAAGKGWTGRSGGCGCGRGRGRD